MIAANTPAPRRSSRPPAPRQIWETTLPPPPKKRKRRTRPAPPPPRPRPQEIGDDVTVAHRRPQPPPIQPSAAEEEEPEARAEEEEQPEARAGEEKQPEAGAGEGEQPEAGAEEGEQPEARAEEGEQPEARAEEEEQPEARTEEEPDDCPWCYDSFSDDQPVTYIYPCQHAIHAACLAIYTPARKVERTCPRCGQELRGEVVLLE